MNGVHDMGGMHGLGAIAPKPNEPLFHDAWESRVLAMTLAMGAWGRWNIDASRHARESIRGDRYLAMTYYERWFEGLTKLIDVSDLANRATPTASALTADRVEMITKHRSPYSRPERTPAEFAIGNRVRAKTSSPTGHTRLPRYVRGHIGLIVADHGFHVFPDSNAHGKGEDPHRLYSVRFTARDLWGEDASEHDTVTADLWEPYLEPA